MDGRAYDDRAKSYIRQEAVATRFHFILPVLAAIAYPWLLSLLSLFLHALNVATPPPASAIAGSVAAILASAWSVMAVSLSLALRLGREQRAGTGSVRARRLAHLTFATPSLLVGLGNVAGAFNTRMAVPYVWLAFWILAAAAVLFAPVGAPPAVPDRNSRRRLAVVHGVSACAILLLFILPHIGNHLVGLWSGAAHIVVMTLARRFYRSEIVEPLLLALIAFQILSGLVLARRRTKNPGDFFDTLQTLTGVYVGVYLLAHMTAAFTARAGGTDTNWNWLTNDDQGLLVHLSYFPLVAHYWVGPVAIVTHVACGLRMVMLGHGVSPLGAGRIAWGLIGSGIAASSLILAGLLGAHLA